MIPFLYASNNENGYRCALKLRDYNCVPELLLLHPLGKGKMQDEIRSVFPDVPCVYWGSDLKTLEDDYGVDLSSLILLSINFGYLFNNRDLALFRDAWNLHIGYLPWNRGSNPNVWSIIEGTPAGVTLHRISEKLDGGEILKAERVDVFSWDTGYTLYFRLVSKSEEMIQYIADLLHGRESLKSFLPDSPGSFHCLRDFEEAKLINLDSVDSFKGFIDRVRALTFPPYKNAYFLDENGRKVFVDIALSPEDDLE
jgi:methionyl-tRNA formyltransferase